MDATTIDNLGHLDFSRGNILSNRQVVNHGKTENLPTLNRTMEKVPGAKISLRRKKNNRLKTDGNHPQIRKPGHGE